MEKYNICLVKPDNYIHSYAFLELGELIYYSMRELGIEANIGFNQIQPGYKNIVIGCHLLSAEFIPNLPDSTVIFNTEQICTGPSSWSDGIFSWVNNFEVWDYSSRNIENFKRLGFGGVKHFKIGFQKELARLNHSKQKDVD